MSPTGSSIPRQYLEATVAPTQCLGHHKSLLSPQCAPRSPQGSPQLCSIGPKQIGRGAEIRVLHKLREPSGMAPQKQAMVASYL